MKQLFALALVACGSAPKPVAPPPTAPEPIAKVCSSAEHRQLDFWIGDWNVDVRTRASPTSEQWTEQHGTQHVTQTLAGCAIEEHFTAQPPAPWAGRSFSAFDAIAKTWRQTWVDDSGSYLAFTGGPEGDTFVFTGEPRDLGGVKFQMRMVFSKMSRAGLHWEWQRSEDAWATNKVMMTIDYTPLAAR